MESNKSVLASVLPNDWLTAVALEDASLQIPMHPGSRLFLRFVFNGTCYHFKVLCFRLSTAPRFCTRVLAQVAYRLHLHNIRVMLYLDVWLILSYSEVHAS